MTVHSTARFRGGDDKCATGLKTATRLPKEGTTTGACIVRSLHACGKIQEHSHELKRYRRDILGLAEIRWTGFGETTTDEGHKIWYCEEDSKHQYGVAFIVRNEVVGRITISTPLSTRLISIRISARPYNITVI